MMRLEEKRNRHDTDVGGVMRRTCQQQRDGSHYIASYAQELSAYNKTYDSPSADYDEQLKSTEDTDAPTAEQPILAKHEEDANDDAYGILKKMGAREDLGDSILNIVNGFGKLTADDGSVGHDTASVFDDSDYDEVLDYTSPPGSDDLTANASTQIGPSLQGTPRAACGLDVTSRSNRSSGASSSGVESYEEQTPTKYGELDIAKILHTRKRIHQTLGRSPLHGAKESSDADGADCAPAAAADHNYSTMTKKASRLAKRYTSYGTVGRFHKKSTSIVKRHSLSARPLSATGLDAATAPAPSAGEVLAEARASPILLASRHASCDFGGGGANYNTLGARTSSTSLHCRDDADADNNNDLLDLSGESPRWSRISSELVSVEDKDKKRRRRWKSWRHLMSGGGVSEGGAAHQQLTREEKKASIHLINCNNNHNNSDAVSFDDVNLMTSSRGWNDKMWLSRGEMTAATASKKQQKFTPVYSCFSPPRRPFVDDYGDFATTKRSPPGSGRKTAPPSSHDDEIFVTAIERRVMSDVRARHLAGVVSPPPIVHHYAQQPRRNFKKRFLSSFKRGSRKSPKRTDCGRELTKAYSSPQLAVCAVEDMTSSSSLTSSAHGRARSRAMQHLPF